MPTVRPPTDKNSSALHLAEQQVLPVPPLCTDRGTRALWPCHTHTMPELWDWGMGMISRGSLYLGFTLVWICMCVAPSVVRFKESKSPWFPGFMCMLYLQESCPSSDVIKDSGTVGVVLMVKNSKMWRWYPLGLFSKHRKQERKG